MLTDYTWYMKAQWGLRGIRTGWQRPSATADRGRLPKSADPARWTQLAACEQELLATPTWGHCEAYQAEVRRLLRQALAGEAAAVDMHYSAHGRFHQVMYVREVNRELAALVDDVLRRRSATALASRMDAIRGLLINLVW